MSLRASRGQCPRGPRLPMLASCAVFLALVVLLAAPGGAAVDESGPATALIDRSRAAASLHEFRGTMVVAWRDGRTLRQSSVGVVASGGVLHLGNDRVVGAGARRLLKTDGGWRLLWSGAAKGAEPDPTGKYRFSVVPGPVVAGRPTMVVAVNRAGDEHVQERMFFDRATALLLRRDQYDDTGRLVRRVGFLTISAPQPLAASAPHQLPQVAGNPTAKAPKAIQQIPDDMSAHRRIGDRFVLLGTYGRGDGGAQLYYSDGLFGLSLFERSGDLAWDDLPAGGQPIRLAGLPARMYPTPAGSAVVWEHDDVTYTCVTDAPLTEIDTVARDLGRLNQTTPLEDIGRFVTGPFSWG